MSRAAPHESVTRIEGPWSHRTVEANGTRLHLAEAGSGPLVVFLHGLPGFWWSWRHQLPAFADAGYRAVAVDLRGIGGSDRPPRGYDVFTLTADIAGAIRALGEPGATLVGTGWGGLLAWSTAAMHPGVVNGLAVLGMAHPLRVRAALLQDPNGQLAADRYLAGFQIPGWAEFSIRRRRARRVETLIRRWSGPEWTATPDFAEAMRTYRTVTLLPGAAHCMLEHHRWIVRSLIRPSGWEFGKRVQRPLTVPTLHLHGEADTAVLARTAQGSGRYVAADYRFSILPGIGHFPAEESPDAINATLLDWAAAQSQD